MHGLDFRCFCPTQVVFGFGRLADIGKLTRGKKVLIVTGKGSAKRLGYLDLVSQRLEAAEKEVYTYSGVSPNPRVAEVEEGARIIQDQQVETVVGLGGGSVMDAAKVIAVAGKGVQGVRALFEGEPAKQRVGLVLAPTTAGTGSETSKGAILSDDATRHKTGVRGDALFADIAIVDPEVTLSMPARLTAETGYDVFTHAVETFLSVQAQPITELLSLEALRLVAQYLPRAVRDGADRESREQMAYASTLMGFNLANSSTCLPHRMQYPVGARTDTSHPLGLAALYPAWIRAGYAASSGKWNQIGRVLSGEPCSGLEDLLGIYRRFTESIGLGWPTLNQLGVQRSEVAELVRGITGSVANDPAVTAGSEVEIITGIYEASFTG